MPAFRAAVLCVLALGASVLPASGGKLDLDIYSADERPAQAERRRARQKAAGEAWRPGDPRDVEAEPVWVRYVTHAGYTGLGVAGLAASIATGGVAPAVGFGIVTVVQAVRGWKLHQAVKEDPALAHPKGS